jgi:hypothetical protein
MQFLRGWRILPEIVSKTSKTVYIPKVSEMQQPMVIEAKQNWLEAEMVIGREVRLKDVL